jgi:hypothetical protein
MDLPSRSEPCKKNEIKTFPSHFSIFYGHHMDRVVNSLCTPLRGRQWCYIYKDHSSNGRGWHHYAHCLWGSQYQRADEVMYPLPLWFPVTMVQMTSRTLVATVIGPSCQRLICPLLHIRRRLFNFSSIFRKLTKMGHMSLVVIFLHFFMSYLMHMHFNMKLILIVV